MSRHTHAAFLSYSTVYRDWVETLHTNLGATGVDQAAKLVLVVTPEALASPWVGAEWQARSRQLDLPSDLTMPSAPQPAVEEARLRELIALLTPQISNDDRRRALATILDRDVGAPSDYGGVDSAAAALVALVGEEELAAALERL